LNVRRTAGRGDKGQASGLLPDRAGTRVSATAVCGLACGVVPPGVDLVNVVPLSVVALSVVVAA
jgi:hypothetical protein